MEGLIVGIYSDENEGEDDEDVDDNDQDATQVSRSTTKTIAIKDLNDLWARRNDGKAIQGNVLAAVHSFWAALS